MSMVHSLANGPLVGRILPKSEARSFDIPTAVNS